MKVKTIGIIGAGPSGLAAAITASQILKDVSDFSGWEIDLIEKNSEFGKKLLATGNGKCNISNVNARSYELCRSFFNDMGILFSGEAEGRMYPHSKQARSVRDILVNTAKANGVNIIADTQITDIEIDDDRFKITDENKKSYIYERLIITTGGKAGVQYGSTGDGYRFVRSLGLNVNPILPALVPMTYGNNPRFDLKKLKGVRAEVELDLVIEGRDVAKELGEIQFTDYGISGICVFNLSRYLREAPRKNKDITDTIIKIDFAPGYSKEELVGLFNGRLTAGLKGVVNEKIEDVFLRSGLDPGSDPEKTAGALKAFTVNINGTKGWKEAQVTSGGVTLDMINEKSMEAVGINNLYLAGEILDYDGPCGGYNLNWAWNTGIKAGLGVVDGLDTDD